MSEPTDDITADMLYTRLQKWERNSTLKNYIIIGLVLLVIVLATGWWFASRDHTISTRNGRVADCRSVAFAEVLDQFAIVAGDFPTSQKQEASARLQDLYKTSTLLEKYTECIEEGE